MHDLKVICILILSLTAIALKKKILISFPGIDAQSTKIQIVFDVQCLIRNVQVSIEI